MRQIYEAMGTIASLDVPGCDDSAVFGRVFRRLDEIDSRFSAYRPDSEVSRYQRGELSGPSVEFKEVKAACDKFEKLTDGYFSANFAGKYDPTGYVKGYAISEAAKMVKKSGFGTFCLGIGGDILAASDSDQIWGIGVQDPRDRQKIIKAIEIKNGAVATSGAYERGAHIINPKAGHPAAYWSSATVTGPDIITADVLATACFAAGPKAQQIIAMFEQYELFAIKPK